MRPWSFLIFLGPALISGASLLAAADLGLPDQLEPGGFVVGKARPDCTLLMDGKALRMTADGRFLFGIGRDAEGAVDMTLDCKDAPPRTHRIAVTERAYDIQRIDGLPSSKVTPSQEDQKRIEEDYLLLTKTKALDSDETGFTQGAVWPTIGRISGVFGSQRILNGIPRSPHRGVDVAAPEGTTVNAMFQGVVTVAADDMYYTGGTVMVDHGYGLQSIYAHLSAVTVEVGQRLAGGEKLGEVGSTGRSTGPHLHLGLYWFDTALDPALILDPMPATSN